jgi:rRNA maturation RNase YbeY
LLKKKFLNILYVLFLGAISSYSLPPYNYFIINFFTFSLFFIFLFTEKKTNPNNKRIKKLNKDFRNKNKPTDVLSFPFEKKFNLKKSSYLGDIIVSYEFMDKPKNMSILKFKQKVVKIFIHGFLHLLGHDHIKLKDFKKMSKEEDNIYKFIKTKVA